MVSILYFLCFCVFLIFVVYSYVVCFGFCFFFFKQRPAYVRRISDWSADVGSSDLPQVRFGKRPGWLSNFLARRTPEVVPAVVPPSLIREAGRVAEVEESFVNGPGPAFGYDPVFRDHDSLDGTVPQEALRRLQRTRHLPPILPVTFHGQLKHPALAVGELFVAEAVFRRFQDFRVERSAPQPGEAGTVAWVQQYAFTGCKRGFACFVQANVSLGGFRAKAEPVGDHAGVRRG